MAFHGLRSYKYIFLLLMGFLVITIALTAVSTFNEPNFKPKASGDNLIQENQGYQIELWINSSYFKSEGTVKITIRYMLDGAPVVGANVTYQIDNTTGTTVFFETGQKTNSTGYN